jgi:hypothetical protein
MRSTKALIPRNGTPTPRVGDGCAARYDYPSQDDLSDIAKA